MQSINFERKKINISHWLIQKILKRITFSPITESHFSSKYNQKTRIKDLKKMKYILNQHYNAMNRIILNERT